MCFYWEGNAKIKDQESVTGTSRCFMEQNSYYCSKREGEMNSKRNKKVCQAEERTATLSVCTKNGTVDVQRNDWRWEEWSWWGGGGGLWDRTDGAGKNKLIHMGDEVREKRGISREVILNTALLPRTFSLLKKEPWAGNRCGGEDRVECWQYIHHSERQVLMHQG